MSSCILKNTHKIFLAFLFSVTVAFGAQAQGASEQSDPAAAGLVPGSAEGATTEATPAGDPAIIDAGETLFKNNCASCHSAGSDVVVGPGLQGMSDRRSETWLIQWIKNSQALIQSGDPQAVAVYEEYNKQAMPSFAFSDDEIKSIIAYVESGKGVVSTVAEGVPGAEAGQNVGTDAIGAVGPYLDIVLAVLIIVLIVLVVVLLLISSLLKNYLNKNKQLDEYDNEVVNQRFDFSKIYKSKAVRTLVLLIFVVLLLDLSLDKVMGIGIQQGYAPKQPIAFSHKLHAGEHQIDCNYCHSTVYESKSASIPSANICMNCHSQIQQQSPEIQKIYRAIERNQPIEWVRIHNLPDLAYFNHSQHTQVGGIECQTCHGPIQEMDVVYQYSPLTMGWCIDCHRETPLNTKGNEYYDNLVKLHEQSSKGAFTVASNGGTECSKCHY